MRWFAIVVILYAAIPLALVVARLIFSQFQTEAKVPRAAHLGTVIPLGTLLLLEGIVTLRYSRAFAQGWLGVEDYKHSNSRYTTLVLLHFIVIGCVAISYFLAATGCVGCTEAMLIFSSVVILAFLMTQCIISVAVCIRHRRTPNTVVEMTAEQTLEQTQLIESMMQDVVVHAAKDQQEQQ